MVLTNAEGSRFEMYIQGYEFPGVKDDQYDSNWLIVKIHVDHPEGSWDAQFPCLLTWELKGLAEWLQALAAGTSVPPELTFIEPNLEFHLLSDTSTPSVRVYFETEFRPAWARWDEGIMQKVWLDFPLAKLNLNATVQSLHQQLLAFPPRAGQ